MNNYRKVYKFDNGYGASVVCDSGLGLGTYGSNVGLFEVAVLKDGHICYDTDITNDVVGWCDFDKVAEILERIKNLS